MACGLLLLGLTAGAPAAEPPDGSAGPAAPTVQQIETLQGELRGLLGQLDAVRGHADDAARRDLMVQHWQAVQAYLLELQAALPKSPQAGPRLSQTYGSAAACALEPGASTDAYVNRMGEVLWNAQAQLSSIHQAQEPEERARLLRQEVEDAYRDMQTLRGAGWMGGRAIPSGRKPTPLPDPTAEGNYLVRSYCAQCHAAPAPALHSVQEWRGVAGKMTAHVQLANSTNPHEVKSPTQRELTSIMNYLADHGCDAAAP